MAAKAKRRGTEPAAEPAESVAARAAAPGLETLAANVAKANLALSEGLSAIGDEFFAYAKAALANASEAAKALLGAKTLDEVIELNRGLAKSTAEAMIARSGRLGELGIATTKAALASLARGA